MWRKFTRKDIYLRMHLGLSGWSICRGRKTFIKRHRFTAKCMPPTLALARKSQVFLKIFVSVLLPQVTTLLAQHSKSRLRRSSLRWVAFKGLKRVARKYGKVAWLDCEPPLVLS